jgi:hypothetical protein
MSNSSCSAVSAAITFIDMATFSDMESFIYGGPTATTCFVLSVHKANWFSFVPICLRSIGTINFGHKNCSYSINRSGDYVLNLWFRAQIPKIQLVNPQGSSLFQDARVSWTRNLMHNLFEHVSITFNELSVQEFDSFYLDFNYQLRLPDCKRIGYRNMIGDIASMTTPLGPEVPLGTGGYFSCPLVFWFSEDSGLALPVAALPFNDIKVCYHLREWQNLVIVYPGTANVGGFGGANTGVAANTTHVKQVGNPSESPVLIDAQTFAHYAVVHNDERIKMGDAPRDMLITQIQRTQRCAFKDCSSRTSFDLRFSHPIKLLMWAALNVTLQRAGHGGGEWSNYTTEHGYGGVDPLVFSSLAYENSIRFAHGSDYFSLTQPYYYSDAIPSETGYHMYSYALKPWACNGASGSTNYSKLANVAISHDMSPAAIAASGASATGIPLYSNGEPIMHPDASGILQPLKQLYEHVFMANNHNIVRIANGSLGHPIL